MRNPIIFISVISIAAVASLAAAQETETPDMAAEYFVYRCAGCHTIGGGNLSGPDLTTSIKWSDADLKTAVKKMEKNTGPISEPELHQMVEFLKDLSVAERISRQKEKIEAKFHSDLPPASYETGQKLFQGQKPLSNGGPACFTCHYFVNGGGTLGPDLTSLKDRASGIVLQSAIKNSSYKIMRPIYEKHKISPEEALHLTEYLEHPEKNPKKFAPTLRTVARTALGGTGLFFILLWYLNRQRKGSTRKKLLQQHSRE